MPQGFWGTSLTAAKLPYDQVVASIPGLQVFYRMLESNGATSLGDSSGNGRSMPLTGSSVFSAADTPRAIGGQSFVDNGTVTGGLGTPAWWSPLTALSVMAWFKTTATGIAIWSSDQNIYGPGDGRRKFSLYVYSNVLYTMSFTDAGGFPFIQSPAAVNDGNWHCAVSTRAAAPGANAQSLYIDGALVGQQNSSGNWSGTSANLTLACTEPGQVWNGSLGPMAIWNRQLTSQEAADLWTLAA